MSKGAIVTILALLNFVWKAMTKLSFILIFVIESFYSIMSSTALISLRTLLCVCKLAQFRSVIVVISSFIFDGMIIVAALVIVRRIFLRALDPFEVS